MSNRSTHLHNAPHAHDEAPQPAHSGRAITSLKVHPAETVGVVVTSDAVGLDDRLDPVHSGGGDNTSPPLAWTAVAEAVGYALVVEDPDAPREDPVLHWVMWDIPGAVTALPAGVAPGAHVVSMPGAVQGRNSNGVFGYDGPMPPAGHGPHRYHFQVFALSKHLGMGADSTLTELTGALKASTLAFGELVATFETPDTIAQN